MRSLAHGQTYENMRAAADMLLDLGLDKDALATAEDLISVTPELDLAVQENLAAQIVNGDLDNADRLLPSSNSHYNWTGLLMSVAYQRSDWNRGVEAARAFVLNSEPGDVLAPAKLYLPVMLYEKGDIAAARDAARMILSELPASKRRIRDLRRPEFHLPVSAWPKFVDALEKSGVPR